MKALVFRHDLKREAASKLAGSVNPRGFVSGIGPCQLEDVPEPRVPGPGWVVCETIMSGLCGSDVKQIVLNGRRDNPLTALVSFPHVLGHEAIARRLDTGERVVLNPWLSCAPRGVDPLCPACAEGRYPWCRSFARGALPPSLHLGNCAGAGGAHAERFVAHESQLFTVPDGVSDDAAVLSDPVSVSLRTVLLAPPRSGAPVLVYGSGPLALAAVALVKKLYPESPVWAATRGSARVSLAKKMGADEVLPTAPDELVAAVAAKSHATPIVPWSGKAWLQDGPCVVYDTIGSTETVETSMRLLETGGTLVVSGVEPSGRFEWTPLYFKELRVIGSNAFGIEDVAGVRRHAFSHYLSWAADGLDLTPLITHRYPLDRWQDAVLSAKSGSRSGAVKILLVP
ncbi:MAG: zinc-dependent alcohol dehydrogenase [Acidimicrobiales bacterium]